MSVEVRVEPFAYTVSAVPEEYADADAFELTVARRGPDQWAVLHMGCCLGSDGEWDLEPSPSNRTDEWKATHRFDLDTALELAKEQAPRVTVNGWTPEQVVAEGRKREEP